MSNRVTVSESNPLFFRYLRAGNTFRLKSANSIYMKISSDEGTYVAINLSNGENITPDKDAHVEKVYKVVIESHD
jgi:hypothetical protein